MDLAPTFLARRLEGPARLSEITERVHEFSQHDRDCPAVRLHETRMEEDGTWRYNGEAASLTRHALAQLCSRLPLPGGGTVPARYLTRCPAPLAARNLNHWLSQPGVQGQEGLVRLRGGGQVPVVRAVLSDRYTAADHLPLLEALSEATEDQALRIDAWSLDDAQLTLRLVVGSDHPASLQDPLRIGLQVANSEVGLSSISVQAFITRLVCSNGLVVKVGTLAGVQRRHVGHVQTDLDHSLRKGMSAVLQQADRAAYRFVQLRSEPAPQPLDRFLERTAADAELPHHLALQVAHHLEGETLYDVVNAFTRVAQDLPVAERIHLETVMSRLLMAGRPHH